MLKVNSKINLSNQNDMDELGKLRQSGNYIVTNRTRTIIKFIGTNETVAKRFFREQLSKRGGAFLVGPLTTVTITKAEQIEALRIHKMINGL